MNDLAALLKYAKQFRSLHTSFTQANNRAPHKFILLYSLCLLYESGSLHIARLGDTRLVVLAAARLGKTRLIDNLEFAAE